MNDRLNGYDYVSYINHYDLYRKIENGKGKWKAVDKNTGEVFDITYEQALGYEPIRPTEIDKLSIKLGEMLLHRGYGKSE